MDVAFVTGPVTRLVAILFLMLASGHVQFDRRTDMSAAASPLMSSELLFSMQFAVVEGQVI